jgi:chromosome segregation ATPase
MPQVDARLGQFKDEMVQLLEQYDERQRKAIEENERLRRVEHDVHTRELASVRRELPAISRLQQEMELRQAEDARLSQLVGSVQNQLPALRSEMEPWSRELAFINETSRRHATRLSELETALMEVNKRWEPLQNRLDTLGSTANRLESGQTNLRDQQTELREIIKQWAEQIQLGEYERNQRLKNWEQLLENHRSQMADYDKKWAQFAEVYKEARMAIQSMSPWRGQLEQKQREDAERVRMEISRMEKEWHAFSGELDKRQRNLELDVEQHVAGLQRRDRQVEEQLKELEEAVSTLDQDRDMLWRVQTAQAEALKQWPRVWLEEVEKTLAQNPNRRRQPALVEVRDE